MFAWLSYLYFSFLVEIKPFWQFFFFFFFWSQCFFQHYSALFPVSFERCRKEIASIPCKYLIYWLNGLLERTVVYFMYSLMLHNWSLFSFFSLPPVCTWENSPSLGPTPCSEGFPVLLVWSFLHCITTKVYFWGTCTSAFTQYVHIEVVMGGVTSGKKCSGVCYVTDQCSIVRNLLFWFQSYTLPQKVVLMWNWLAGSIITLILKQLLPVNK